MQEYALQLREKVDSFWDRLAQTHISEQELIDIIEVQDQEAQPKSSLVQHIKRCFFFLLLSILFFTSCFSDPSFSELQPHYAFHYLKEGTELKPLSQSPALYQLIQNEKLYPKIEWDHLNGSAWQVKNQWTDRSTESAMKAGLAWMANSGLSWEEKYREWLRRLPINIDQVIQNSTQRDPLESFELVNPQGKRVKIPALYPSQLILLLRASFASFYHLPFVLIAQRNQSLTDQQANATEEEVLKHSLVYFGHFGLKGLYGNIEDSANFSAFFDHSAEYEKTEIWKQDLMLRQQAFALGDDVFSMLATDFNRLQEDENIKKIPNGQVVKIGEFLDDFFCNKRTAHWMLYLLRYFSIEHIQDDYHSVQIDGQNLTQGDILLIKSDRLYGYWIKQADRFQEQLDLRLAVSSRQGEAILSSNDSKHLVNIDLNYLGLQQTIESQNDYNPFNFNPYWLPTFLYAGGFKRMTFPTVHQGYWLNSIQDEEMDFSLSSQNIVQLKERTNQLNQLTQENNQVVQSTPLEQLLNQIRDIRQKIRKEPSRCELRTQREVLFESLYELLFDYGYSRERVDEEFRLFEDFVFQMLENNSKTCCWHYEALADQTETWGDSILKIAKSMMDHGEEISYCYDVPKFMTEDGHYAIWEAKAEELNLFWPDWDSSAACVYANHIDTIKEQGTLEWCLLEDALPAGKIWLQGELNAQEFCLNEGVKRFTLYIPIDRESDFQQLHVDGRVVLTLPQGTDALMDISVVHQALNVFVQSEQREVLDQIEQDILNEQPIHLEVPNQVTLNISMLRGAFYDLRIEPKGLWRNLCQEFSIGFYR
jgi:hypothetical protein